jgi:hypothetical protein
MIGAAFLVVGLIVVAGLYHAAAVRWCNRNRGGGGDDG